MKTKIKLQNILSIVYIAIIFLLFVAVCVLIDSGKPLPALAHAFPIPFMVLLFDVFFPSKDDKEDAV